MTWEEAKVIRSEYPRRLTNAHIREIFERWGDVGNISQNDSHMFYFACTPRKDGKMNITELKLWFMFDNKIHEHEIKRYNHVDYKNPILQKSHGMIIFAWFNHIIDGGEYEPITQNLRKRKLKHLLEIWKNNSLYFPEQAKGVQCVLDIKNKTRTDIIERYPDYKNHYNPESFENKCLALVQKFINEHG